MSASPALRSASELTLLARTLLLETITAARAQIAADNAVFGQTGPKVGSFDAGYGSTQLARLVGQKKAREVWFLARMYNAQQARARTG